jgi:2-polyprenyl-3-methyl-5-hydroxy-6-metoxy-1,4-benzoquinol methylase
LHPHCVINYAVYYADSLSARIIVLVRELILKRLAQRDRQPELMDQPGLDREEHRRALNGLRTTNSISGTSRMIWRDIMASNAVPADGRPLRILDIATGGGDVLLGIAELAIRSGVTVEAHGCDVSSTAVEHAGKAANRARMDDVRFFQLNALVDALPQDYDMLMCTLFLHHLTAEDAKKLLQRMADAARQCVVIDDLQRTRLGYTYAWVGSRLITRSRIVHTDGPLSVRAAFTISEARQLASDAGLHNAQFREHWPQRFLMTWKKNG